MQEHRGASLQGIQANSRRDRELLPPSEQGTSKPEAGGTAEAKPRLRVPELTLGVTCCSAEKQGQPGRRGKKSTAPRSPARQEATPKHKWRENGVGGSEAAWSPSSPNQPVPIPCVPAPTQGAQGAKPASPPLPALVLTPTWLCPNPSRSTPVIQLHHHIPLQHCFTSSQLRSLTPPAPSFPLKPICTLGAQHFTQSSPIWSVFSLYRALLVLCHPLHIGHHFVISFIPIPAGDPPSHNTLEASLHTQLCREMPRKEAAALKQSSRPA